MASPSPVRPCFLVVDESAWDELLQDKRSPLLRNAEARIRADQAKLTHEFLVKDVPRLRRVAEVT